MLLFLFFFKQKTAYEMRISDWSSDVCSSDLQHQRIVERLEPDAAGAADRLVDRPRRLQHQRQALDGGCKDARVLHRLAIQHFAQEAGFRAGQPGLATDVFGQAAACAWFRQRIAQARPLTRSEGGRVGKEGVRTCRSRGSPSSKK